MIDSLGLTHRRKKNSHIQTLTHPDIYLHKLLYQWRYRSTSSADVYLFICILIKCQKINISFLQETNSSTDWSSVHKPNLPFDNPLQEWVKKKKTYAPHFRVCCIYRQKANNKKKLCHFHSSIYSNYGYLMFVHRLMALSLCFRMWNKYYLTSIGNILIKPKFLFLKEFILIELYVFSVNMTLICRGD